MILDACKACSDPRELQRGLQCGLLRAGAAAALAAALGACTSIPQPTEQVEAARAAVAQAQPAAAREGAAELQIAQAKLARAEDAMQRGNYVEARVLAEQAEVDARYAWTVGENARQRRAAAEAQQSVGALQQELDRRMK